MKWPKIKTITKGMCIPWGLSWYTSLNPIRNEKRQLVLCVRLPFYWRESGIPPFGQTEDTQVFGSAVLRIRFWDDFKICWVPDYTFCHGMINLKEIYHGRD